MVAQQFVSVLLTVMEYIPMDISCYRDVGKQKKWSAKISETDSITGKMIHCKMYGINTRGSFCTFNNHIDGLV